MSIRLPPLNALRAFEAAARRGGFTSAARELHVTPAAVSHQIKTLESHLNTQLFRRLPRGLEITAAGRQLLPQLTRGLEHFSRAVEGLNSGELAGPLTINTAPSFAALWLVPRLESFLRAYPDIELCVQVLEPAPDLNAGEVDIRLPYGMGNYPGFATTLLMREQVSPVCAPSLLNQSPLRRFADLRHHTLLHDVNTGAEEPTMTWRRWLRDAGVSGVDPERGVKFGNSILVTEAALRGQGVALGRTSLVGDHLATGRLVRPLKASRPADYAYYAVTTHAGVKRPRIQAFLGWIETQIERDAEGGEGDN
jgi:LysR family transcriptional regulator, glycine cleavage system transcriptional activator